MRDIVVLSYEDAANYACENPWCAIQISHIHDYPSLSKENRAGLLQLNFPDLVKPFRGWDEPLFTSEQAHEILDFVNENWDKCDTLMVHCRAGISRSPAVAAAVEKIKRGDCLGYFENCAYSPNMLVFNTILEVAKERKELK